MTTSLTTLILLAMAVLLVGCGGSPRPLDLSNEERAAVSLVSSTRMHERDSGRERMLRLNPDWPPEIQQAVTAGEVTLGMTRDQVLASWGFPFSRWTHTFIAAGQSESWRYRCVKPPMDVSFGEDDTVIDLCAANEARHSLIPACFEAFGCLEAFLSLCRDQ